MGLLEKLKSFFGSDSDRRDGQSSSPEVTVEREPDPESEHAVKGTKDESTAAELDEESQTDDAPTASDTQESTGPSEDTDRATDTEADAEVGSESEEADSELEEADSESEEIDSTTDEADSASDEGDTATDEETESAPDGATAEASPPVDEIRGIGPTYAGRLESIGVETVADLAGADPDAVADAAETSTSRATDWITQAKEYEPQDG